MTTWVVVGGSGFIGAAIVKHAVLAGYTVRVVKAPRLVAQGRGVGDLRSALEALDGTVERLALELAGATTVINAAGIPDPDVGMSAELMGANALLPAVVGRAASLAGAARYVHVSSATVQGRVRVLTESEDVAPFSAYSLSKALGEMLVLGDRTQSPSCRIVRPVSVQAASRRTTERLVALARSPLASVAGSAEGPAPLSLLANTAAAIVFTAEFDAEAGSRVVLLPGDGLSVREVLVALGARRVRTVPTALARAAVGLGATGGRAVPRLRAEARRAEMLWFGQRSDAAWLREHGFSPPVGREGWSELAGGAALAPRPRLLAMVTIALSVRHFLDGQLGYLQRKGFDVSVLSSEGADLHEVASRNGVRAIVVPMAREISPLRDIRDLFRMRAVIRAHQPDLVNFGTPKASLLGGVAAWTCRVPVRVYTLHGLRLETISGLRRAVLYAAEWLTCRSAHVVLCVSSSLREEAVALRLVRADRAIVLGEGSCNGVDTERFASSEPLARAACGIRRALGWPDDAPVVGFAGRLTRDKGVAELVGAFRQVRARVAGTRLLLVGDFEEGDPVGEAVRREIEESRDIVVTGMLADPSAHFQLFDVLALPSYREGLGNVILEAAVAGVPAVATNATGIRDAIIDGATGLLVPVGEVQPLADALVRVLEDKELRARLGAAARERAVLQFEGRTVWERAATLYEQLLDAAPRARHLTRVSGEMDTRKE